jgi:formylglycine-generating enzyme required for sulfatase activity
VIVELRHCSRWRYPLTALLGVLLALLASPPADAARRALVVGNDNYTSVTRLRNARADAEAMADAFRKAGYEVDLALDRTLKQLQADVRSFRRKVAGGDEVVVFFSGHGVQLGGTNYLLPTDVGAQNEDQVKDDALSLSSVLEGLRERKPRFTLAIVDACRDNPFASTGRAIGGRGLTGVSGATGQMVIYAAGEGQRALDRLGPTDTVRNGLFTRVFLQEIAKPGVPIRDVLYRVRDEVATLAETVKHEQVPAVYDQVRGTFYFLAPTVGGAPVPPPAQPPLQVATVVPEPVRPAPAVVAEGGRRAGEAVTDCAVCPPMVFIPAGQFQMGSVDGDADEKPVRMVSVPAFWMGRTEVTQGQWKAVMGSNPSEFKSCGDDCPVENVTWDDAQAFIRKLNEQTGWRYRLPSEVEWEYAARAGSRGKWSFGDNESQLGSHAWFYANSGKQTRPVAGKQPNAWSLYDMHGNVWEWVQDVWHDNYSGAPTDGSVWSAGGDQARRVLRGGSGRGLPRYLRSAVRIRDAPGSRGGDAGFRIARTL